METVTILIVDDHELVRLGLRTLLQRHKQFAVVGDVGSGRAALDLVETLRPQVVLLDVRMPDMNGVEACREITSRRPETRVIMITSFPDNEAATAAVLAGASGYLLKNVQAADLVRAITTVARGGSLVDPMLAAQVFARIRTRAAETIQESTLNRNERLVLGLISLGKTNREIAGELGLSEKTVRNYVTIILDKLGLSNRAEAAAYATRRQLMSGQG